MKLDENTEKALASKLSGLHIEVVEEQLRGGFKREEDVPLADIRDYFIYLVLRCEDRGEALEVIRRLDSYAAEKEEWGDMFYTAFFFTLSHLLRLRFESEETSYEVLERSLAKTLEHLGIRRTEGQSLQSLRSNPVVK